MFGVRRGVKNGQETMYNEQQFCEIEDFFL